MKINWTARHSLTLSRLLTAVMLILAGAALFCIPIVTEWYDAVSEKEPIRIQLTTALYLSNFLGITALLQLMKMLEHIAKQKMFVEENTRCMRIISWCCFGFAVIWAVMAIWRPISLLISFIAAFAGLIVRVMKNMLAMAIELREENDFTI